MKLKSFRLVLLFIGLILIPSIVKAQEDKRTELATQYFNQGEYQKAAVLYEDLVKDYAYDVSIYQHYLDCLLNLKEFKSAEKLAKRFLKSNPTQLEYKIDVGRVYKIAGDEEKAKKEFEASANEVGFDQNQVINIARYFSDIGEVDYAMKTYLRGRKLLGNLYGFNFEIAQLYNQKGDYENMILEYLNVLELGSLYLESVQNALQASIGEDTDGKKNILLKTQLLKKIQSSPNNYAYPDMLIWLYIQEKDFEAAFVQTKALERRQKLDGSKIIALAALAIANKNYDVAAKCYQYIIDLGKSSSYFTTARMELVNTLNIKITSNPAYNQQDLLSLQSNYQSTLSDLGKSPSTIQLIRGLAHLQAFYLNKTDSAIVLLTEAIDMQRAESKLIAECKLELADILLFTGEIWETTLLYGQVEKSFKEEPIGQEAKFRSAKLSYYHGDFAWSKAQLDVLKSATAKLIANDALDLSLLISDNSVDSNFVPLEMYARADLLVYQNKDSLALITLDSISKEFPTHPLADELLFKKYQIAYKKAQFEKAAQLLQQLIDNFPLDILGDNAYFKLAELNEYQFKNSDKAKELYQTILTNYPGSLFTVEARKRFRTLRGDSFVN